MRLLQISLVTVYMLLLPYLTGCLVLSDSVRRREGGRVWTMAAGLMVSYALYELLALGFVWRDGSFRLLSVLFAALSMCLAAGGAVKCIVLRRRALGAQPHAGQSLPGRRSDRGRRGPDIFFLLGLALIGVQIGAILLWETPDRDDAFYSGLSSICLSRDSVLQTDAYNGLLVKGISKRYVLSALPVYQATLSLMSGDLHHLVITHNLFPLFYMPLAYGMLYCIGKEFLVSEGVREAKGKLLFCLALLHMIGNYFVFSPENFLVTRIWQGKALFVALGVPCLWHFATDAVSGRTRAERARSWCIVSAVLLALSFMGETGLFLGPFMLICLCIADTLTCHKFRQWLPACLCCLPQAVMVAALML